MKNLLVLIVLISSVNAFSAECDDAGYTPTGESCERAYGDSEWESFQSEYDQGN